MNELNQNIHNIKNNLKNINLPSPDDKNIPKIIPTNEKLNNLKPSSDNKNIPKIIPVNEKLNNLKPSSDNKNIPK